MEVVEGQGRQKVEEYLDTLPDPERVKGVAMDMHEAFRQAVPNTLDNWREEILNYFDYPITNGFVEGKNNRIKTIKRMAYGYRNMDNFRLRILATNSKGAGS